MKLNKKTIFWVVFPLILLLMLGTYVVSMIRRANETVQPSAEMVVQVKRGDLEVWVTGTATVNPVLEEMVKTSIAGTVETYLLEEGKEVVVGDKLVTLKVQDLSLEIERAELDQSRQNEELKNLQNQKEELKKQTDRQISSAKWQLEQALIQLEKAKLDLARQETELDSLIKGKERTVDTVRATGDGVLSWHVGLGDEVYLGDVIATIKPAEDPIAGDSLPALSVEVKSPVNGVITEILEKDGNMVTSGQHLVALDNRERYDQLAYQVSLAELQLKQLQLQVDKAREDVAWQEGELANLINDSDPEKQLNSQIALAELQLKQVRSNLDDLRQRQQENLDNAVIEAPISGTVLLPEAGSAAVGDDLPLGTILATIVDYSNMEVKVPIDELDISRITEGQKAEVTLEALPGEIIAGQVVEVATRSQTQGGVATFVVTIAIELVPGLRAGMNADAVILVDTRSDTLLLPIEAVFDEAGASMVMIAVEDQEGKISDSQSVRVVTGAHNPIYIEILSGVQEGQQIVIPNGSTTFEPPRGDAPSPFGGGLH